MFIDPDLNTLLTDLELCRGDIKKIEKVSGYKIDELIQMFKNQSIKIMDAKEKDKKHSRS